MSIKKAILQVLNSREETHFDDIVRTIRQLHPNRKSAAKLIDDIDNYIWDEGITDTAVDRAHSRLVFREKLFSQTQFRILPNKLDLENRCLIFGHRLMPFINPEIDAQTLQFEDETGAIIPHVKVRIPIEQAQQFTMLIAPYSNNYFEIDIKNKALVLSALDLSVWLNDHPVSDKDMWMVIPIDYTQRRFRLTKISSKQIAEQKLVINRHDELLKSALLDIIETEHQPVPVDLITFWAYASINSPSVVQNPGSPIGPFLTGEEDWQLMFEGSFSYLQSSDFFENLLELAIEQQLSFDPDKMGKAKTIDGILDEMGNSYSEAFIAAKMVIDAHHDQESNLSEIMSILFPDERYGFYNPKQQTNFNKAVDGLVKKLQKIWSKKRLSMQSLRLLGKIVQFKMEIVGTLREFSEQDGEVLLDDFSAMMQFHPIDNLLDQLMDAIVWGDEFSPQEAHIMNEQLTNSLNEFMQFKRNLLG